VVEGEGALVWSARLRSLRICSAPARTSKSLSAAAEHFAYAATPTEPICEQLHWLIGPTYNVCKEFDYLFSWLAIQKRLDGANHEITQARNNPANGDMIITIEHRMPRRERSRSIIRGMSSTNERMLQGEEVTMATLSEAAEHPEHIWKKYLETRCWRVNFPTTPKAYAEWLFDLKRKGDSDPELSIESFHYPKEANPLYNEERFRQAKLRASMSTGGKPEEDPWFAEQFLGEWGVFYTGRVLPFEERKHTIARSLVDLEGTRIFLSLDYGYEDAAVCLFWQVRHDGILVIFDEIYETGLSTPAFVEKIMDRIEDYSDQVEYVVGDPSRPEVARIFRDCGLRVFDRDKNAMRDRAAGTRRLVDALSRGPIEGLPGLYVTENCHKTRKEWKYLRYREGMKNEYAPNAWVGDDHACDAARYGIQTRPRPGVENLEDEGAWVREHQNRKMRRHGMPRWAGRLMGAERRAL
jgi:hypothetical protein